MNVNIKKSKLRGSITAKPSKSFAHRYLFASLLANNESVIKNVDFSNDINATLNCIYAYGKRFVKDLDNNCVFFSQESLKNFEPTFDCDESGTTLRIFMPIAMSKYESCNFIGKERLIERGVSVYENIFKYITFDKSKYSIKTKGGLTPGRYELVGNVSSQYISGLLYALPLLKKDSEIVITTELESKNYILMTLDVLKKYGIDIKTYNFDSAFDSHSAKINDNPNPIFKIRGNQKYMAKDFSIEGDFSNIAFIDAFNYFGNSIRISGLNYQSIQSDKIYKEYFDKLNAGYAEIDIMNCIDLGPVLVTFAALKNGAKFTNTKRLKIKESDRGFAIAEELKKCNADIIVSENEIIVNKKELIKPDVHLKSHNDHRIVMALSLLSTQFDICIDDASAVNKSYPKYFEDLKKLGAAIY